MCDSVAFGDLPDLLVSNILSFVGGKDLAKAACVCKQWKSVTWTNPETWRSAYIIDFGGLPPKSVNDKDWHAAYLLEHRWRNDYDLEPTQISANQKGVLSLIFDESHIISGGWDASIKIWSVLCQTLLATLTGHTREVVCLSMADNNKLVSGSYDSTIRVWDLEGRKCGACLLCVSDDGEYLSVNCLDASKGKCVSGHDDGFLKILDVESGHCELTLVAHEGNIMDVHLDVPKNRVVTSSIDLTIKMWSFDSMNCLVTFGDQRSIYCMSVVENLIICGSVTGLVVLWDEKEGEDVLILDGEAPWVRCVHFDGKRIVSAASDKYVKMWDVTSERRIRDFHGHSALILSVKFDDTKLITGSLDDLICIWDFQKHTQVPGESSANPL
ncbi:hypothetical protein BSKO_09625 [Bryopsis sp. KO-2023]|nr:hypothetical protein BSKO_09625 [Bryopsis sp. KO-2023]